MILNASNAEVKIPFILLLIYLELIGRKSSLSRDDLLLMKIAGIIAKTVHGIATQIDKSLTPWPAPSGNQEGS